FVDLRAPAEFIQYGSFPVFLSGQNKDLEKQLAYLPPDRQMVTGHNNAPRAWRAPRPAGRPRRVPDPRSSAMTTPELLSDFGPAEGAIDLAPASRAGARRFLLWDLPLRVFHWSLVAAVTTAIVTGELGGAWMPWHGRAGLAIVGLLVFRIVWGFVGSATARFTQFAPTPARVLAYLR